MVTKWDSVEVRTEKVIDENPAVWINVAEEELAKENYDAALENIQRAKNFSNKHSKLDKKFWEMSISTYMDLGYHWQDAYYYDMKITCDVMEAYIYAKKNDYGNFFNKVVCSSILKPQPLWELEDTLCRELQSILSYDYEDCDYEQYFKKFWKYWNKLQEIRNDKTSRAKASHFLDNFSRNILARRTYRFYKQGYSDCLALAVDSIPSDLFTKPLNLSIEKVSSEEFYFVKILLGVFSKNKEIEYTVDFIQEVKDPYGPSLNDIVDGLRNMSKFL